MQGIKWNNSICLNVSLSGIMTHRDYQNRSTWKYWLPKSMCNPKCAWLEQYSVSVQYVNLWYRYWMSSLTCLILTDVPIICTNIRRWKSIRDTAAKRHTHAWTCSKNSGKLTDRLYYVHLKTFALNTRKPLKVHMKWNFYCFIWKSIKKWDDSLF